MSHSFPIRLWFVALVFAGLVSLAPGADAANREPMIVTVHDTVLNTVDDRLFGHFMERASFGEPGYDTARDPANPRALQPAVVEKLAWLQSPIVRWPAGSDLARIDWRDAIDNVPGRTGPRPVLTSEKHRDVSNEFGLDEFLALAEKLNWAALLPVRIKPALTGTSKPADAAREAAALVAYCNAPAGAKLPAGMVDWPAIRTKNGRKEPWNVKYFQIGNETWLYYREALRQGGLEAAPDKEKAEWYLTCLRAYLTAMHEVDPHIQIIVDGTTGAGRAVDEAILRDPFVRQHAAFYAVHLYQPWRISEVQRNGTNIPLDQLSADQAWYAWVTTPGINPETFQSQAPNSPDWWLVRDLGLPVAVTEWNWNGWWVGSSGPLNSELAKGIGAAGMLHAFMRSGDSVRIACQSMMVGEKWGITGVRVGDGQPPRLLPTALVTGLYARHHGRARLFTEYANVPTFEQPYRMGAIAPAPRVAYLDVVVTRTDRRVYLHVINRHLAEALPVRFDLRKLGSLTGRGTLRLIRGQLQSESVAVEENTVPVHGRLLGMSFPPRSVCVLQADLE